MNTTVRPLDERDYAAARQLTVAADQRGLVASVASSLESAVRYPGAEPLGIFLDRELVGFLMGQLLEAEGPLRSYLIWDLLVDGSHQRQGIGRAAIEEVTRRAAHLGAVTVTLAYEPTNTTARDLYRSAGFVETGSINADGEHEMVRSATTGSIPE